MARDDSGSRFQRDNRRRTTSDLVCVITMVPITVFFAGYLLSGWNGGEAADAEWSPGQETRNSSGPLYFSA